MELATERYTPNANKHSNKTKKQKKKLNTNRANNANAHL